MDWKRWVHGLAAAAVGSLGTIVGTGVTGFASGYSLDWQFWEPLLGAVAVNMWISVQLYIRQFPPPGTLKPQEPPKS